MASINGTTNDDTLLGTASDDTVRGLSGIDTAQIASASSGAVFSLDAQGRWVVTSGQGVDTLVSVEGVSMNGETFTFGVEELAVNVVYTHYLSEPQVTGLADGGWLVTWASNGSDGSGWGVYQRRFDANGDPTGPDVRVSSATGAAYDSPSVTALSDGGWVVSWVSVGQDSSGWTGGSFVRQQRYDAAGNAVGSGAVLSGDGGDNTLVFSGSQAVHLAGGDGNDTLVGGDGLDTFVFALAPSATNVDTLLNFVVADDTIRLGRSVFSALSTGPLAAGAFVTGTKALDADDRIIFNSATGALLYDADGSGAGAAVQFATLVGIVGTLSAADFSVV